MPTSIALIALLASATPHPPAAPMGRAAFSAAACSVTLDPDSDALVKQLRGALVDRRDAELDQLMRALRMLHDPALKPMFALLASGDRPVLRVHSILGLAELEDKPRVDLLLVKRLTDPHEQLVVIGEALRAGMLDDAQMEDVVRWPGLDETLLALVLERLQLHGRAVDQSELSRIAMSANQAAAVFAALTLSQAGAEVPTDDKGATPLDRLLAGDPGDEKDAASVMLIVAHIREERLTRLVPLLRAILARVPDDAARIECLRSLLAIAPSDPQALRDWTAQYASAPLAVRLRMGLAALDLARRCKRDLSADVFAPMMQDEAALPRLMGAAGAAVARDLGGADLVRCVSELVATTHPPSIAWALDAASARPPEESAPIRLAAIQAAAKAGALQPELYQIAAISAMAMCKIDPAPIRPVLADAADSSNEAVVLALLSGALQSGNPACASLAEVLHVERAVPMRSARALADLLVARYTDNPEALSFDRLAAVASGDGSLPEAYRLQAAWLALRARNEQRAALARVLAEAPVLR